MFGWLKEILKGSQTVMDDELYWLLQKRIEKLAKQHLININSAKSVPLSVKYLESLLDSVNSYDDYLVIDDYLLQQARLAAIKNKQPLEALRISQGRRAA